MAARSKARRRALEILFEAEQRELSPADVLASRARTTDQVLNEYVPVLVNGVVEHRETIDELLSTYARGWTIERMPRVDLQALRIGAWEILHNPDIPDGVAVAEAVALTRELSTEESPRFVNGVLGRIQKLKPTLTEVTEDDEA
ncbi:transcription antitermination factor NusB [Nesterenkonia massiliensis]|uniref:Transcription antitermination protein NusB n=1 Tax=Nesterenkonia massiliensis TaxID=1232429 RepID=A0ABT2HN95_9MICC|nr:transcription antitermination factor NusB [Nesterenkonia massiliensis]MCT1606163.1 transcription antitermination factor NusB [Nesterenkonia massiliensis]